MSVICQIFSGQRQMSEVFVLMVIVIALCCPRMNSILHVNGNKVDFKSPNHL